MEEDMMMEDQENMEEEGGNNIEKIEEIDDRKKEVLNPVPYDVLWSYGLMVLW